MDREFFTAPGFEDVNAVDVTGVIRQVGFNTYEMLMRRGFLPLAGQATRLAQWRSSFPILVGSDLADAPNVRAGISCYAGVLSQQASGLADTFISGSL